MLTKEQNRRLTEVTGDAPMGRFMREYWIPVIRGEALAAGAPPVRLTILGQRLVAFRSPEGEVGVMDEQCPHRGVSMALARNEPGGLRCIYHGWKVSAAGLLCDAPTHPANFPLNKLKTRSHPVREQQGMVWTYLGKGAAPRFRELAWTGLPDDHVLTATSIVKCDWMRPIETLWDVFHSQFVHADTNRAISFRADNYFSGQGRVTDTGLHYDYPEMKVQRTPYGFTHANIDLRKRSDGHMVMPFFQYHSISPDPLEDKGLKISVPIDNENTLVWSVVFNRHAPLKPTGYGLSNYAKMEDRNDLFNNLKNGAGRGPENRWHQDRDAMASGTSFSGYREAVPTLTLLAEDIYVLESQGAGYDRTRDQLGPVDRAVAEGRRMLLDVLDAYEAGEAPHGRDVDATEVEATYVVNPLPKATVGA